jgi:hypothetical protein
MSEEIDNRSDILDVRDIIERFEELEHDKDLATDNAGEENETVDGVLFNEDNQEEHDRLKKLLDELKGNGGDEEWQGDWYPITLIHRDYFEDYAQELASDVVEGFDSRVVTWPFTCIDWEAAANELEQDYSNVYFDGEEYLYR